MFIEEPLYIILKCLIRPGMYFSVNYLIWFLRIYLRTLKNTEANLSVNSENIEVKYRDRSSLKLKHSLLKSYNKHKMSTGFTTSISVAKE